MMIGTFVCLDEMNQWSSSRIQRVKRLAVLYL